MDLEEAARRHREAAHGRGPAVVKDLRPSLRDFARYVTTHRDELAVIAEWRPGGPPPAEFARAAADAGAYGISVAEGEPFGGTGALRTIGAAAQVPVLARALVLDEQDLYRLRAEGADAAVVHARLLEPAAIGALRRAARSMMMEILVVVSDDAGLARALASDAHLIAVAGDDRARAKALLARIPEGRVPLLDGGVSRAEELGSLLPAIDAVVLPIAGDPARTVESFVALRE